MIEKPAKGQKGFFLYSPIGDYYWFRVYDPEDKRKFTDYKICAEDIEVEIICDGLSLYEKENGEEKKNQLDWSSRVLGRPK